MRSLRDLACQPRMRLCVAVGGKMQVAVPNTCQNFAPRSDEENELSIFPPISNAEGAHGFGALLPTAMAANVEKLREATPRETHLVVWLDRSGLYPDPACTPAPKLSDGIDVLWVLLGYFNAKWTYRLWRTTASDRRWHLLRHPLGKLPAVYPPHAHRWVPDAR
jgi:hypothetical protein